jgi:hypothetical protein
VLASAALAWISFCGKKCAPRISCHRMKSDFVEHEDGGFYLLNRKEKYMRYYLPIQAKNAREEKQRLSLKLPLWVWIVLIAALLLIVLALR